MQSMGSQSVGRNLATEHHHQALVHDAKGAMRNKTVRPVLTQYMVLQRHKPANSLYVSDPGWICISGDTEERLHWDVFVGYKGAGQESLSGRDISARIDQIVSKSNDGRNGVGRGPHMSLGKPVICGR